MYVLSHIWLICHPIDCSPPGSSVDGIFQARILDWVAIFLLQRIRNRTLISFVSCTGRQIIYHCVSWEVPLSLLFSPKFLAILYLLTLLFVEMSTGSVSSVAQSCSTLCNPMDCSTPGLPVHHQLLELTQTHLHWVGDAIQPSNPRSSPSPPAFNLS